MEERLLFDGVAMRRVDVAVGRVELSSAVEAHLADSREAGRNGAPVTTREALHAVAVERFVEFRFARLKGESIGQGLQMLRKGRSEDIETPGPPPRYKRVHAYSSYVRRRQSDS